MLVKKCVIIISNSETIAVLVRASLKDSNNIWHIMWLKSKLKPRLPVGQILLVVQI